jgi:phage terminase Nu1 subunit (DNA packaging protein)
MQYAKERGVSDGVVRRAIKANKLNGAYRKLGKRYLIDAQRANKIFDLMDPEHVTRKPMEQKAKGINAPTVQPIPGPDPDGGYGEDSEEQELPDGPGPQYVDNPDVEKYDNPVDDYAKNRANREKFQAKTEELKYRKQAGELVEKDIVIREAVEMAKKTKDAVLAVPARVAAQLAAMNDRHKVEMYLESELREALRGVSNEREDSDTEVEETTESTRTDQSETIDSTTR